MQQGVVQVTPTAGLKCLLGDAVVEGELVLPEGGHDAGPWRHNLLALVVADGECVSDGCLQGDAAFHYRLVDLQQQRIDGLPAAVSPLVGKAC